MANCLTRGISCEKPVQDATGYDLKAVTFQASGGMNKHAQNIFKQLSQQALPEQLGRSEANNWRAVIIVLAVIYQFSIQQYAAEIGSKKISPHDGQSQCTDFIAATARIAKKRLLFIPKVDLHFKTLWSHVSLAVSSSSTMPISALWFRSSKTSFL